MKKPGPSGDPGALRSRAEERLRGKPPRAAEGQVVDPQRLVHELQVHQIELEMQNEELKRVRAQLERELQRYADLYDFAPAGYLTISSDGTITEANLTAARMLGAERSQLMGKPFSRFVSVAERNALAEMLSAVFAGVAPESLELAFGREGDLVRYAALTPSLSSERSECRLAMVDISERRRIEEHLRVAQKMEAIGHLAGGVAHDFNNLLTAILGYSAFALRAVPEGRPGHDELVAIKTAGERAAEFTRQLLAFSNRQVPNPQPLDLNQILSGVRGVLRSVLGEQSLLELKPAPDLWPVLANPGQMEQVLVNLTLNARDSMPSGGRVVVETSNVEFSKQDARRLGMPPGEYVLLSVADTGQGMDEATRARLFDPVFAPGQDRGTGLGLAIVHGIVKQSRGHVWVSSSPGRGALFQIYLPREHTAPVATPEPADVSAPKAGTETVLVVEDEPSLLEVTHRVLAEAGYTVLSAASGAEALRLCASRGREIQLVVTDVIMPEMTGPALARRLSREFPDVKVLFMSGYAGPGAGTINPGEAFIAKPFAPSELTRKVRAVLDKPRG